MAHSELEKIVNHGKSTTANKLPSSFEAFLADSQHSYYAIQDYNLNSELTIVNLATLERLRMPGEYQQIHLLGEILADYGVQKTSCESHEGSAINMYHRLAVLSREVNDSSPLWWDSERFSTELFSILKQASSYGFEVEEAVVGLCEQYRNNYHPSNVQEMRNSLVKRFLSQPNSEKGELLLENKGMKTTYGYLDIPEVHGIVATTIMDLDVFERLSAETVINLVIQKMFHSEGVSSVLEDEKEKSRLLISTFHEIPEGLNSDRFISSLWLEYSMLHTHLKETYKHILGEQENKGERPLSITQRFH